MLAELLWSVLLDTWLAITWSICCPEMFMYIVAIATFLLWSPETYIYVYDLHVLYGKGFKEEKLCGFHSFMKLNVLTWNIWITEIVYVARRWHCKCKSFHTSHFKLCNWKSFLDPFTYIYGNHTNPMVNHNDHFPP